MNVLNYATINVTTISPSCSIDAAISLMEEHNVHHLVVVDKGRVVGMLSDRDILISTGWMLSAERQEAVSTCAEAGLIGPTTVQEIMSTPAICLDVHETASEAASLMVSHKFCALPIVNMGRLVGILTDSDLLKWLEALGAAQMGITRFLSQPLESLMRTKVITVAPDTLLTDITDLFRRNRIRHVPVMKGELLAGIISDRDVRRSLGWSGVHELQRDGQSSSAVAGCLSAARDVMQTAVHWIKMSANLGECLRLMLTRRVHSVPVLEAGKLVGIITHTDFIKAIAHQELL